MTKAPNTKRRHVTMRGVLHACLALGLVATMFTAAGTSPGYAQLVHDGTTRVLYIGDAGNGTAAKVLFLSESGSSSAPANWYGPDYNDATSQWMPATPITPAVQQCAEAIPGWNNTTKGYYGSDPRGYYLFRQDFQLPYATDFYGTILSLAGTDSVLGDVYVNGNHIFGFGYDDPRPPSNGFQQAAIGQYLQTGSNVIAFELRPNAMDGAHNPCNAVTFSASLNLHTGPNTAPAPSLQPFGASTLAIGGAYAKVIDLGSNSPPASAYPDNTDSARWTYADFDDSAWMQATQVTTPVQNCAASNISSWGGSTGYYGPSQIEHYIFRQSFQLPYAIDYYGSVLNLGGTSGVLGDVYVNGNHIFGFGYDDPRPPSNGFQQVAIGQDLRAGSNVIAFELRPYDVDAANNPCNAVTFTANITMNTSPTATPTSPPTNTPTDTPYPSPTNTPTATPTNTPYPLPTATPTTAPSSTPIPTTPPTIPTTPPGAPTPSPTPTGEQNKAFGSPTPTLSPTPPTPTRTAIVFLPASRCGKPVVTRILVNGRSLRQRPDVTHGVAASVTIHVSDRTRVSVSVALTHQVRTVGRHGRIGHKTVVLEQASGNVTPGRRGYATANLRLARLHKGIGAVSLVIGAHPLCGTSS